MHKQVPDFPSIINLGIYRGGCQCKCVHCPVGITEQLDRRKQYGYGEIGVQVFQHFCSEIKNYQTTVRLHGVGEPTMHSQFRDLLAIIRTMNLEQKFWIFTNGLFNAALIPDLTESLGLIEISVNATNPTDYLHTKGIDGFHIVLENIQEMKEWIHSNKLPTRIVLTKVQSGDEKDREFVNYWRTQEFECFVRSFHTYSGILHTSNNLFQTDINTFPKCQVPWRRFNLDGTISNNTLVAVQCFNVLFQRSEQIDGHSILGKFPETDLAQIWHGDRLQKFRQAFELGQTTFSSCDLCTECLTDNGPRAEDLLPKQR